MCGKYMCIAFISSAAAAQPAPTACQPAPIGPATKGAAVCCVRCCGICSRANGAARCSRSGSVALVWMQAGRVSPPARTRTSAESTTGPVVAAVSADIDGNGCICVEPALCADVLRAAACTRTDTDEHGRVGVDKDRGRSCSYLSDRMSLSAHQQLLCVLCWLAWCSRQADTKR